MQTTRATTNDVADKFSVEYPALRGANSLTSVDQRKAVRTCANIGRRQFLDMFIRTFHKAATSLCSVAAPACETMTLNATLLELPSASPMPSTDARTRSDDSVPVPPQPQPQVLLVRRLGFSSHSSVQADAHELHPQDVMPARTNALTFLEGDSYHTVRLGEMKRYCIFSNKTQFLFFFVLSVVPSYRFCVLCRSTVLAVKWQRSES